MNGMRSRWRMWSMGIGIGVCVAAMLGTVTAGADAMDWETKRAALGHEDRLRVLVDKVLSPSNKWVMTEKFMDEIRDAGFNVVVPRIGGEDLQRVERVANMARDRGMFYMAWMRGTLSAQTGTKLVWANGAEQDLYSPNADELWDWMAGLILGHARLSATNPAIIGSFLDFENYAKGKQGNCYALSYDDTILEAFAAAKHLELPALQPAERHPWLEEKGLFEDFRDFQIEAWRKRCRALRQQIDAINPRFQLIVYPRGTLFLNEAIYPEWATEAAPLIFADHCTYHRPGQVAHAKALAINKRALESSLAFALEQNVPVLYIGGIDPVYEDADPEFCGKNAAMIADCSNGYWIFYEGPVYDKDHPDYFHWFARANRAIQDGQFGFWREPRETPDPIEDAQEAVLARYCGASVTPYSSAPMPEGENAKTFTVRTRDSAAFFAVLLEAGERIEGRLEVRRLGTYMGGSDYVLFAPDRSKVAEGGAEVGKPVALDYTAQEPGLHVIAVDSSENAARLFLTNPHFCLIGTEALGLLGAQPRACFIPKKGVEEISLTLSSPSPGETAMLTLFDSDGREVGRCDTVESKKATINVSVGKAPPGKPWSVTLGPAPKGGFEDLSVDFEDGCAEFLATHPSRLLVPIPAVAGGL